MLENGSLELLFARIDSFAREYPEYVAVEDRDHLLTYGELSAGVRRRAKGFAACGASRGDLVVLLVSNSAEFVLCHLALMKLGAVTVPLDPGQPAPEISARIAHISPRGIIASSVMVRVLGEQPPVLWKVVIGNDDSPGWTDLQALLSQEQEAAPVAVDPGDPAAVMFTSGAGGRPHCIELTHQNLGHQATQVGRALRVRSSDRVAAAGSFAGIFGLTLGVHLPLAQGATVQIFEQTDLGGAAEFARDRSTTILVVEPKTLNAATAAPVLPPPEMPSLRYLICAGGRLAPDARRVVESQWKRPVLPAYGLTEASGLVSIRMYPIEDESDNLGEPLGETEVAILDQQSRRLGAGKTGRIAVRSPGVMRAYWGQPERTADAIRDGWLITDDIGTLDYHSRLTVHGHSIEIITKGGFLIYASEVEDVLLNHPAILEAAVVGVVDPVYGEELKAYVVCRDGASVASSEVVDHLRAHLPIYKCPRIIKFYKELPHTPGGRIVRGLLRDDRA